MKLVLEQRRVSAHYNVSVPYITGSAVKLMKATLGPDVFEKFQSPTSRGVR